MQATLRIESGNSPDTAVVSLTIAIASPWYIYVKSSRNRELEARITLIEGASPVGDWQKPKARSLYQVGERVEIYRGEQILTQRVKLSPGGKKVLVRATLGFQACDPSICRPPEEVTVTAEMPGK